MVKVLSVLHNFIKMQGYTLPGVENCYCQHNFVDRKANGLIQQGNWCNLINENLPSGSCFTPVNWHIRIAAQFHDSFASYFFKMQMEKYHGKMISFT